MSRQTPEIREFCRERGVTSRLSVCYNVYNAMRKGSDEMSKTRGIVVLETYCIAAAGGFLFHIAGFPLAWILGSMTAVILWKSFAGRALFIPDLWRNGAFSVIGIYLGLLFTANTLAAIGPYIVPFLLATVVLVGISIGNGLLLCRIVKLDPVTGVFGTVPGGLSEMVAASDSLGANVAMVTLLQTVRLLTVVFFVPFTVVHLFAAQTGEAWIAARGLTGISSWHFLWYILPLLAGRLVSGVIPAPYVIGPLIATAFMNISGVPLPAFPDGLVIWAQITVGFYMGRSFSLDDLKRGGKWAVLICAMTIGLIAASFAIGYALALLTDLSLSTTILSVAPGGLVEMAMTAVSVGADAPVVASLQLVRLLFIILFVPGLLKLWFQKRAKIKKSL